MSELSEQVLAVIRQQGLPRHKGSRGGRLDSHSSAVLVLDREYRLSGVFCHLSLNYFRV